MGDYNIAYQFLIALLTYIPIKPLLLYKALSCVFDFALAIGAAYLIKVVGKNSWKYAPILGYALVLLSPIVFLNSAWWSQCDSIYCSFIVLSLACLIDKKPYVAFVLLGIAFAFKLQAVFVLPFYVFYYLKTKSFTCFAFLLIPAMMFVSSLPGVLMGRSPLVAFTIYLNQANEFNYMFLNYPSIWAIFTPKSNVEIFDNAKTAAILLAFCVLLIQVWGYLKLEKDRREKDRFFTIVQACAFAYTCVLFLPSMHERYGYLIEVLIIIIAIMDKKIIPIAIAVNLITLTTYGHALTGMPLDIYVLAVINVVVYAFVIAYSFWILLSLDKSRLKRSNHISVNRAE